MGWYRTGTLSLTNGSATVTGSGTAFIANVAAGEALLASDGKAYEIASVNSNTSLTLGSNFTGTTGSGLAYAILPSQSYIRDLAAEASALFSTYASIASGPGAGKFDDGTVALPGISFASDANTGLFRSSSDVMNLVAGGATRMAVTTAGAAVTGTLTTTGNATLGDSTSADSHTVNGVTVVNANSATDALRVNQVGAGNALVIEDSTHPDSTPFVVNASGCVVHGHTDTIVCDDYRGSSRSSWLSQLHTTGSIGCMSACWSAGQNGGGITFAKSRSATIGVMDGTTSVIDGDDLGGIGFAGDGGGSDLVLGASIVAQVDGTPGADDMPTRLVFRTAPDGTSAPTERMRIDSNGRVGIGATNPSTKCEVWVGDSDAFRVSRSSTQYIDIIGSANPGIRSRSPTNNAKLIIFNSTTDDINTTPTVGECGHVFQTLGSEKFRIRSDGEVLVTGYLRSTTDIRADGALMSVNTTNNSNSTATASAASLKAGIRTGTPTAAIELQVPTGTNMDAAFFGLEEDQSFEWSYINLAAATHACTITSNTGHTLVGNMVVPANSSGRFLTRKSTTNTFITYRIA